MAFENMGVGAVLRFDEGNAVAGMGRASAAFNRVESAAGRVRGAVSGVAAGFSKLSFGGGLLGAAGGLSFGAMIADAAKFGVEMEGAGVRIATILKAVSGKSFKDFHAAEATAVDLLGELRKAAIKTPAEMGDLVNIFSSIVGPAARAGESLKGITVITEKAAIAAGALGIGYEEMGSNIFRMLAGQVENEQALVRSLRSMGLLTESTEKWKAMLPAARLARIKEILDKFGEAGDRVGKTMKGLLSTTSDLRKNIILAFLQPALGVFQKRLEASAEFMNTNFEAIAKRAAEFGERFLVPMVNFMIEQFQRFGRTVKTVAGFMERSFARVHVLLGKIGVTLDSGMLKKAAGIGAQIVLWMAALGPVLTVLGFLGGKIGAIITIVKSLSFLLLPLAKPLLIAAAAAGLLFLIFRKDGESFLQTFTRLGLTIRDFFVGFYNNVIKPLVPRILGAVNTIIAGAKALVDPVINLLRTSFSVILNGIATLRPQLEGVVRFLIGMFETVASFFARAATTVAGVIDLIARGLEFLRPVITTIIRVFGFMMDVGMAIFSVWTDVFVGIGKAILSVVDFVVEKFGQLASLLAPIGQKIRDVTIGVVEAALNGLRSALIAVLEAIRSAGRAIGLEMTNVAMAIESLKAPKTPPAVAASATPAAAAAAAATAAVKAGTEVKTLTTPAPPDAMKAPELVKIDLDSKLIVDGKVMATAVKKHEIELSERAGFGTTPWARRAAIVRASDGKGAR